MSETYSTLHTGVKVTNRVFCSEQIIEGEPPFKFVIKDLEGKLLGHLIFKTKDQDGITTEDLLAIVIERLFAQQDGVKKASEIGYALARARECLLWLHPDAKK